MPTPQETEWDRILLRCDPESDLTDVVAEFFIPDNIDPRKFAANYYLLRHFHSYDEAKVAASNSELTEHVTKTMQEFDLTFGFLLGYPKWFVAAYPDLVVWSAAAIEMPTSNLRKNFVAMMLLHVSGGKAVREEDGTFKLPQLRTVVDFYIDKVNPRLECVRAP